MPAYIIAIFLLLLMLSCSNSIEKNVLKQFQKSEVIVTKSNREIIDNYELLLENFSSKSIASDSWERVFCSLDSTDINDLNLNKFRSTISLLKNGYKIELDAKHHYRIFYVIATKEYLMGMMRYGVLFHDKTLEKPNIYSLNIGKVDTIHHFNENLFVIKENQYAE